MQRARAAEGKQREVARIVPARQRDQANGPGHAVVGDAQDGGGGGFGIEPQPVAHLLAHQAAHMVESDRMVDA